MHPSDKHYRNMALRLSDLAVTDAVIKDVTFENCVLIGPAVVALLGSSSLTRSTMNGTPASMIWEVTSDRPEILGAIGLEDCVIVGCTFQQIGFAVPTGQLPAFRAGLGI